MARKFCRWRFTGIIGTLLVALVAPNLARLSSAQASAENSLTLPRTGNQTVNCEILVVGGGLAGIATSYEALLAGRTVCLTEITDWVGGQIS